jgi:hypothetical protein
VRIIGIWLGLLVLLGAVVLAAQTRSREAAEAPRGPWVDLPPGGMDVSSWAARQWLRSGHLGGIGDGLAAQCGHDPALPQERYVARLPDGRQGGWRAIIDPRGDTLWVTATRDPRLRLDPDSAAQPNQNDANAPRAAIASPRPFPRDQLDAVRRSWRAPALWSGAVSDADYADLSPLVVLEACVDGEYAVRLRHSTAARQLASALDELLASPAAKK